MTHSPDTAVADAIGLAKKERRAGPVFHLLRNLCHALSDKLSPEEWDLLDSLPVVGGRAADDDLNERYLGAWDRYDELRRTMKRPAAMQRLIAEFPDLDEGKLWDMTAGRVRHLRELRKQSARPNVKDGAFSRKAVYLRSNDLEISYEPIIREPR